jgi:hypothetical protein
MVRRRIAPSRTMKAAMQLPGLVLRDATLRAAPQDEEIKLVMTR